MIKKPVSSLIQVEQGFCQHKEDNVPLGFKRSRGSANTRNEAAVRHRDAHRSKWSRGSANTRTKGSY